MLINAVSAARLNAAVSKLSEKSWKASEHKTRFLSAIPSFFSFVQKTFIKNAAGKSKTFL